MKPLLLEATGMPTPLFLGTPRRRAIHLRGSVGFGVHKATLSPSSLVSLSHFIHEHVPAEKNLIQFASGCAAGYWGNCGTGVLGLGQLGYWSGGVTE